MEAINIIIYIRKHPTYDKKYYNSCYNDKI